MLVDFKEEGSGEDTGLFKTGVLERSKSVSNTLSLPLLHEPLVSFLRLNIPSSHQSLFFTACNCKQHTVEKCKKPSQDDQASPCLWSQLLVCVKRLKALLEHSGKIIK